MQWLSMRPACCALRPDGQDGPCHQLDRPRGLSTLVLVHRKPLVEQWVERLSDFLGIPSKAIGRIGGGRRRATGEIDVAMVQTLARGEMDDFARSYGHVVIDECHHVPAVSIERVLAASRPATSRASRPHRIGETAISRSSACNAGRSVMSSTRRRLSNSTRSTCASSDGYELQSRRPPTGLLDPGDLLSPRRRRRPTRARRVRCPPATPRGAFANDPHRAP